MCVMCERLLLMVHRCLLFVFQPLGGILCPVCQDHVCAGALNGRQYFQRYTFFIYPALFGSGLYNGELTAYIVCSNGIIEFIPYYANDIKICQSRFYHHDISSFFNIQGDLAQRLLGIMSIHLV